MNSKPSPPRGIYFLLLCLKRCKTKKSHIDKDNRCAAANTPSHHILKTRTVCDPHRGSCTHSFLHLRVFSASKRDWKGKRLSRASQPVHSLRSHRQRKPHGAPRVRALSREMTNPDLQFKSYPVRIKFNIYLYIYTYIYIWPRPWPWPWPWSAFSFSMRC